MVSCYEEQEGEKENSSYEKCIVFDYFTVLSDEDFDVTCSQTNFRFHQCWHWHGMAWHKNVVFFSLLVIPTQTQNKRREKFRDSSRSLHIQIETMQEP